MITPQYFIVGVFPVKFVRTPGGGLAALELDLATGMFVPNLDRYFQVIEARDGVKSLTADEFIQRVESIRSRVVTDDSPVAAVYKLIVGIEDVAMEESRPLRPDEEALIAELRRQSHALFEAEHPIRLAEIEEKP